MMSKLQTLIGQCHKSVMLQLILLSRCVPCTSDDITLKWYCIYQASRAASYCWGTGEACCWGTTAAALLGSTTVGGGWASAIDASRMRFCCSFFWYLWPERRWAAARCFFDNQYHAKQAYPAQACSFPAFIFSNMALISFSLSSSS